MKEPLGWDEGGEGGGWRGGGEGRRSGETWNVRGHVTPVDVVASKGICFICTFTCFFFHGK